MGMTDTYCPATHNVHGGKNEPKNGNVFTPESFILARICFCAPRKNAGCCEAFSHSASDVGFCYAQLKCFWFGGIGQTETKSCQK